jgi:hypothetical protein
VARQAVSPLETGLRARGASSDALSFVYGRGRQSSSMTRITWSLLGLGVLVLLIAWSFRDHATLWRGRWRALPLQPSLSSEGRDGDWTMWRGDAQRTGVQAQPGPTPSGQVQWRFVNGAGFVSSPIVAGDSLYVGDTEGRLSRLHRSDGRVIWQLQKLGPLDSSPAVAGD